MLCLQDNSKRNKSQEEDIPPAIRPIPHGPDFPVLEPDGNTEYSTDCKHSEMTVVARDNA